MVCLWNMRVGLHLDAASVLLLIAVFFLALYWLSFPRRLPPGPFGVPLFGYLPFLTKEPHVKYTELSKKYGPVFTVWFGSMPAIILHGFDAVNEAFVDREADFMNRPIRYFYLPRRIFGIDRGLLFSEFGEHWKDTRKFTLTALKDFGVGKVSLETQILSELEAVSTEFAKNNGKPFNPRRILKMAASNVIASINFGKRLEYTDEKFTKLLDMNDELFRLPIPFTPVNIYPWLRFVPGFDRTPKKAIASFDRIRAYVREFIEEHRSDFDKDNIRDFIDHYLKGSVEAKENGREKWTDEHLFQVVVDLFNAGTETTATSLGWLFLYLIKYPEVQIKVQEEIRKVIGERYPKLSDRNNMPYVQAVISEMQRHANIAPFAAFHSPIKDTLFRGYNIPRRSIIFASLYSVHRDPKYWTNPDEYNPSRFLDEAGNYVKNKAFMPFSTGRRMCLGMQLATMELFMFFTFLLQRFHIKSEDGAEVTLEANFGITRSAKPYNIIAEPRQY